MNSIARLCAVVLSAFALPPAMAAPAPTEPPAQVYVSALGKDNRNGTRLKPKRTFQAAHDAVAANGQIIALDSAEYGPVSITKAVTIAANPGVIATISSPSEGVRVGTGTRVTLRGLHIKGTGSEAYAGIYSDLPVSLRIEQCAISGFGSADAVNITGALVVPTSDVPSSIVMCDTVITDCPGSGVSHGLAGGGGTSSLLMERCRLIGNGQGLIAGSVGRVTVRESVIANNAGAGLRGGGFGGGSVRIHAEHCAITGNGTGVASFQPENVVVSNTSITGNTVGVTGTPSTFGNNQLLNNTTDGSFGAVVPQK